MTFAQRKCEALARPECAALEQHLGSCPDCAAFANAERRADATFGAVMRDVPVPADLSQKVLQRLAEQPPVRPWRWMAASAAAILIAAATLGVWYAAQPTELTVDNLIEYADALEPFVAMPAADVEKYFANEGLAIKVPSEFDYDYLRNAEVTEFRNRRVGKLYFRRHLSNGVSAQAFVLILPHSQFHVEQLPEGQLNHATSIDVKRTGEFTYVIYHRGNLGSLRKANAPV